LRRIYLVLPRRRLVVSARSVGARCAQMLSYS
jgi:hypothetical protein